MKWWSHSDALTFISSRLSIFYCLLLVVPIRLLHTALANAELSNPFIWSVSANKTVPMRLSVFNLCEKWKQVLFSLNIFYGGKFSRLSHLHRSAPFTEWFPFGQFEYFAKQINESSNFPGKKLIFVSHFSHLKSLTEKEKRERKPIDKCAKLRVRGTNTHFEM